MPPFGANYTTRVTVSISPDSILTITAIRQPRLPLILPESQLASMTTCHLRRRKRLTPGTGSAACPPTAARI